MKGKRATKQIKPALPNAHEELITLVLSMKTNWSREDVIEFATENNWEGDNIVTKILEGQADSYEWMKVGRNKNTTTPSETTHKTEYTRGAPSFRGGRGGSRGGSRGGLGGRQSIRPSHNDITFSPRADNRFTLDEKLKKEQKEKNIVETEVIIEKPKQPSWADRLKIAQGIVDPEPQPEPQPIETATENIDEKQEPTEAEIIDNVNMPSLSAETARGPVVWPLPKSSDEFELISEYVVVSDSDVDPIEAARIADEVEATRIALENAEIERVQAEQEAERLAAEEAKRVEEARLHAIAEAKAAEEAKLAIERKAKADELARKKAEVEKAKKAAEAAAMAPVEIEVDVHADASNPIISIPNSYVSAAGGISFGYEAAQPMYAFGAPQEEKSNQVQPAVAVAPVHIPSTVESEQQQQQQQPIVNNVQEDIREPTESKMHNVAAQNTHPAAQNKQQHFMQTPYYPQSQYPNMYGMYPGYHYPIPAEHYVDPYNTYYEESYNHNKANRKSNKAKQYHNPAAMHPHQMGGYYVYPGYGYPAQAMHQKAPVMSNPPQGSQGSAAQNTQGPPSPTSGPIDADSQYNNRNNKRGNSRHVNNNNNVAQPGMKNAAYPNNYYAVPMMPNNFMYPQNQQPPNSKYPKQVKRGGNNAGNYYGYGYYADGQGYEYEYPDMQAGPGMMGNDWNQGNTGIKDKDDEKNKDRYMNNPMQNQYYSPNWNQY